MPSAKGIINKLLAFVTAFRTELLLTGISVTIIIISLIISLNIFNQADLSADRQDRQDESIQFQQGQKNLPVDTAPHIFVDIQGAIEKPDVYEVTAGARLKDVLILAHGLSGEADRDFFNQSFNLAKKLTDQEKIYIPSEEEVAQGRIAGVSTGGQDKVITNNNLNLMPQTASRLAVISINTASSQALEGLPGIGPVTAQKIIDKRPYASIDELLNKKIVSKGVFEKIKALIRE